MNQFDKKYGALRKFLEENTELLESEKPVGQSAARIEEQMKTCQVCCYIALLFSSVNIERLNKNHNITHKVVPCFL